MSPPNGNHDMNSGDIAWSEVRDLRKQVDQLKLQIDMMENWLKAMETRITTLQGVMQRHLQNVK